MLFLWPYPTIILLHYKFMMVTQNHFGNEAKDITGQQKGLIAQYSIIQRWPHRFLCINPFRSQFCLKRLLLCTFLCYCTGKKGSAKGSKVSEGALMHASKEQARQCMYWSSRPIALIQGHKTFLQDYEKCISFLWMSSELQFTILVYAAYQHWALRNTNSNWINGRGVAETVWFS